MAIGVLELLQTIVLACQTLGTNNSEVPTALQIELIMHWAPYICIPEKSRYNCWYWQIWIAMIHHSCLWNSWYQKSFLDFLRYPMHTELNYLCIGYLRFPFRRKIWYQEVKRLESLQGWKWMWMWVVGKRCIKWTKNRRPRDHCYYLVITSHLELDHPTICFKEKL
jgi:hypothetical protein